MIDVTRTTTLLLEGLFHADDTEVWREFDTRYRPIVFAFARRLGLDDADAQDVAQETVLRFLEEYRAGRYDRERGRLRTWLITLARTRVATLRHRQGRAEPARGGTAIIDLEDEAQLTTLWNAEQRTVILREALEELRKTSRAHDRTIRAFELLVLQQTPVAAVAETLGMSRHDVYLAKHRMASRLREIVTRLERAFDEETA